MKKNLLFIIVIVLGSNIEAQKFNISYGGLFGINKSFLDSKTNIREYLLAVDPTRLRNLSLSTTNKANFGFNLGIFLKVQPVKSRFSFETDLLMAKYNNSYTISVKGEAYFGAPWRTAGWLPTEETEKISNEFNIINIPLIAGVNGNYNCRVFGK